MGSDEKFCLRWNDFQTNLKTSYSDHRKSGDFSDVTLACEDGGQMPAHRIVLSSASSFFRTLLAGAPHPHPLVYMRGITRLHLAALLDFIYHGEAEVTHENLEAFLQIGTELGVKGIVKQAKRSKAAEEADDESAEWNISEPAPPGEEENFRTKKPISAPRGLPRMEQEDLTKVEELNYEDEVKAKEQQPRNTFADYFNKSVSEQNLKTEHQIVENNFDCDQCGKSFSTKGSLRTHKYNHTLNKDVKVEGIEDYDPENTEEVIEDLDKTIGDNIELETKIDALIEQRDRDWHCLHCGKVDNSKFHLRRHAETHIDGFSHPCSRCDKTFGQRDPLKKHMLRAHPEVKISRPFSCDICGKASKSKSAVGIHKQRNHKE